MNDVSQFYKNVTTSFEPNNAPHDVKYFLYYEKNPISEQWLNEHTELHHLYPSQEQLIERIKEAKEAGKVGLTTFLHVSENGISLTAP